MSEDFRAYIQMDPFEIFEQWFHMAKATDLAFPNAMTLATTCPEGFPNARVVLLKMHDPSGFTFFTNYNSVKGHELAQNQKGALLFWWEPIRRQIRIRGYVTKTDEATSDNYFQSRPRDSRIGAWASEQSNPIDHRTVLESRFDQIQEQYKDQTVPRPPHWGGYHLAPTSMEFWQEGEHRLHNRVSFKKVDNLWAAQLLAP